MDTSIQKDPIKLKPLKLPDLTRHLCFRYLEHTSSHYTKSYKILLAQPKKLHWYISISTSCFHSLLSNTGT